MCDFVANGHMNVVKRTFTQKHVDNMSYRTYRLYPFIASLAFKVV